MAKRKSKKSSTRTSKKPSSKKAQSINKGTVIGLLGVVVAVVALIFAFSGSGVSEANSGDAALAGEATRFVGGEPITLVELGDAFVVEGIDGDLHTILYEGSDGSRGCPADTVCLKLLEDGSDIDLSYVYQAYAGGTKGAALRIGGMTYWLVRAEDAGYTRVPHKLLVNTQSDGTGTYLFKNVPESWYQMPPDCDLIAHLDLANSTSNETTNFTTGTHYNPRTVSYGSGDTFRSDDHIQLDQLSSSSASFNIWGAYGLERSTQLGVGDVFTSTYGRLRVLDILYQGYAGGIKEATICWQN